jgi:putative oxidoreductase
MAVAYFVAHAPRSFFPLLNDGRPAVAFCFVFLHLAVVGGGAWSLDRLLERRDVFRWAAKESRPHVSTG